MTFSLLLLFAILPFSLAHASEFDGRLPEWVQNIFKWYAEGMIGEQEVLNAIEYLVQSKTIVLDDLENMQGETDNKRIQDVGDFYVTYKPNSNTVYVGDDTAISWLKSTKLLEYEIEFLNEHFRLPYDVEIIAQDCHEINAFYDYETKQIVLCYELIDDLFEVYYLFNDESYDEDQASVYAYDVLDYILLHEVAHAIIDIYSLPITGLEENVADQFSALMLSYTFDEETGSYSLGQDMLYNVGTYYLYEDEYWNVVYPEYLENSGQSDGTAEAAYWGEHGLDIQRFYNISCYTYGSDIEYNQNLIDDGWLPEDRSMNCEWEYYRMQSSWEYLLQDYTNGFFTDDSQQY